jgi:hypothetical protein
VTTERNDRTPLRTVEEAEARRAALLRIPSLREYAERLDTEEMVRRSLASHAPERYRAKPARRARTPRWSPSPTVRLPAAVDIGGLLIDPTADCGDDTTASLGDYRIDTSADGTTWATAAEGHFGGPADTGRENAVALRAGTRENVRYIRLTLLGNRAADNGVDCAKESGPSGCRYLDVTEPVVHGAPHRG